MHVEPSKMKQVCEHTHTYCVYFKIMTFFFISKDLLNEVYVK